MAFFFLQLLRSRTLVGVIGNTSNMEFCFDTAHQFFQSLLRNQEGDCLLEEEYPLVFDRQNAETILVENFEDESSKRHASKALQAKRPLLIGVEQNAQIVAGFVVLPREILSTQKQVLDFLLIGSVVTAPAARNQGIQKKLFEWIKQVGRVSDFDALLLWSNQLEFYKKLGFFLGGLQGTWSSILNKPITEDIQGVKIEGSDKSSTFYQAAWFEAFNQKKFRPIRNAAEMKKLFEIPKMKIAYTQEAYALVGKGEDFKDICHEWAGPSQEVITCLEALRRESPGIRILSPGVTDNPDEVAVLSQLERAGFEVRLEYLGLFYLLSPQIKRADLSPANLKETLFVWGLDSI